MKASILTLVAAASLAFGTAAQAHLLAGDSAGSGAKALSSQSVLAVMQAAGIRYHAAANYKSERLAGTRLTGQSSGVRPDDRPGPRGI
jgi:hypothetical protein